MNRITRAIRPLLRGAGATLVATAIATGGAAAAESSAESLTITIRNVEDTAATLWLEILDEQAFQGGGEATAAFMVPPRPGAVTVSIDSLPPGAYAIRVMQDLDGDGELTRNAVGMPTDPWGISNDALGQFGPPTWEDARFEMPGTTQQTITLRAAPPVPPAG